MIFIISKKLSKLTPEKEAKVKAVKAAKAFIKKCDADITANDQSNALREFFNNRFNLTLGFLTPGESYRILKEKGCTDETARRMEWFLKKTETYIYTGKGDDACDLADEAHIIIKSVEKEIK